MVLRARRRRCKAGADIRAAVTPPPKGTADFQQPLSEPGSRPVPRSNRTGVVPLFTSGWFPKLEEVGIAT